MPYAPDLSGSALDDRYELHAVIGEGAFGRVYEGLDRRLARPVAVKVIKPWWTEDPDWVATFEREAQLLARVSAPGIVQIFDVGSAREGLYYVSELVDGENLASRLSRGPLSPWDACGLAGQLCRALAYAHAQRIVHRDIKPANILLSSEGRVKVGDFGVARLAEGSTDGAATIVGTPKYMAPEQGRGLPTTPATDIYSVGVVLYEMLAGRPPFAGESVVELALRHLQDPPPPLPAHLPRALVTVTERALAKEPAERYADGAQMAGALDDARRRSAGARRERLAPARARTGTHAPRRALVSAGGDGPAGDGPAGDPRGPATLSTLASAATPPRRPPRRPGPDTPPLRRADATRPAPRMSKRRNANPAARRRAAAALGLVLALLAAMAAGAILLQSPAHTRVPTLTRLSRAHALAKARLAHVRVAFDSAYSSAAPGTVIAQHPRAGVRVDQRSQIHAVLSKGPAPVKLPGVSHESLADAERSLHSLGLHTSVSYVAAPATAPGVVVRQAPAGERSVTPGSTVALAVAETPNWRPLTTFTGQDSGAFHISGERWRLVYSMAYQGTCTWIFFCSGPKAHVVNATTGQDVGSFGLNDGSGEVRTFSTGPGTYEVKVTPGGDNANWSVQVDDYY